MERMPDDPIELIPCSLADGYNSPAMIDTMAFAVCDNPDHWHLIITQTPIMGDEKRIILTYDWTDAKSFVEGITEAIALYLAQRSTHDMPIYRDSDGRDYTLEEVNALRVSAALEEIREIIRDIRDEN